MTVKIYDRKKIIEPNIVVIGGGTGLSVLLSGLKKWTPNITAIVTVADDGGGSGILREDLGMLPPGDIRACLLALANTEPQMEKLLKYRFDTGSLQGQSFGNLFLAAMNGIYGSFEMAIKEASNVLAITGKVYPMTLDEVKLKARLKNGNIIQGESNIPQASIEQMSRIDRICIEPKKTSPLKEGLEAIEYADLIVFGPGSLYTSVIPNLLIDKVAETIERSRAKKVYICNVMTQPGETAGYSVLDHLKAIWKHSSEDLIDYVIINKDRIPEEVLDKYITDGARRVVCNQEEKEKLLAMGIGVIEENLIDVKKEYIRHDNDKLSEMLFDLAIK